jgi:hypothetical protein
MISLIFGDDSWVLLCRGFDRELIEDIKERWDCKEIA